MKRLIEPKFEFEVLFHKTIIKIIKTIRNNLLKIYFFTSLSIMVFAYGMIVDHYKIFPYHQMYGIIHPARAALLDWIDSYRQYLRIRPDKHIFPEQEDGDGVTINQADKTYDGLTLIVSMWNHKNGIQLIDMDGSLIHEWKVSFNEIFPKSHYFLHQRNVELFFTSESVHDWDVEIHGAHLYFNGDIVFNFDFGGLVKIDKNSEVIWRLPYQTHHSIHEDESGNLWVCGYKRLTQAVDRLPLLVPPIEEEFILKISPDGEILKEISILDVFYNSNQEALLFANGKKAVSNSGDITHMNDIEILDHNFSDKFPLFDTGDIMVSIRNLNLIVVIDSSDERIKWSMTGPFIRQHDPDFLENGLISVFDNKRGFGNSKIQVIDPVSRKVSTIYKGENNNLFYTEIGGKHQILPNGNILISEFTAGRVFEVTSAGEIVWSYTNRYDENEVYSISEGTRYPNNYGNFINDI